MVTAIVVLGKSLHPNGNLDFIHRGRVDKAIDVAKRTPHAVIIFSGGKSHLVDSGAPISEAKAMYEYAIKFHASILKDREIILEEKGDSTIDQMVRIKTEILQPRNINSVELVTDEIHIKRAGVVFRHILGQNFTVNDNESSLDIAGNWRKLIEKDEAHLLSLAESTRLNKIEVGDHLNWLKMNEEYKRNAQKAIKSGVDPIDSRDNITT